MHLTSGTRLGVYEILEPLGSGGMGDVYRARDTRLNRSVAIKFLAAGLVDPLSLQRFQQEAQTASSLNHPHIVTVFETGEFDGRQFLVVEFIDGGTLRDWVTSETRTWRQIVDLMVGVADGLATAHAAGILHRDIKPENILVARNGYAKLADFGLAKPDGSAGHTAAVTVPGTRQGVVVGTIAYMSPEQASGKPLDARSDIFSFGLVLYELVAGRRAFTGVSDLEVLQQIIHGTPQPLPNHTPASLRGIIEKALERDPAERYQSTRELVVDLRRLSRQKPEASSTTSTVGPAVAVPPAAKVGNVSSAWRAVAVAALVLLAVGSAVGGWLWLRRGHAPVNPLTNAQFTRFTDFDG